MISTNPEIFLRDHTGLRFSIAQNGKHFMKYAGSSYTPQLFDPRINMCQLHPTELIFEADYIVKEKNVFMIAWLCDLLRANRIWFMRTSHEGKSEYVWIVLTKSTSDSQITQPERAAVLELFAPPHCTFDKNLAYTKIVRQIPNTFHWKHSRFNEEVIEVIEGNPLNIDDFDIKTRIRSIGKFGGSGGEYHPNYPNSSYPAKRKKPILIKKSSLKNKNLSSKSLERAKLFPLDKFMRDYSGTVACPQCHRADTYFVVDNAQGRFFCNGCRTHGNHIDFLTILQNGDMQGITNFGGSGGNGHPNHRISSYPAYAKICTFCGNRGYITDADKIYCTSCFRAKQLEARCPYDA